MNIDPGACWGMIADDLTGACDTGVQFAARGIPTVVVLDPEFPLDSAPGLTVLSTGTRSDKPRVAEAKVAAACAWLVRAGAALLYKKIDSVMRGPVADEVRAALKAGRFESAVLTPAFPALGRTVRRGRLYVAGRQPDPPVNVAAVFAREPRVRVLDAVTDADLDTIIAEALARERRPLLVGSGGLAAALARRLAPEPPEPAPSFPHGPVLFAIGSTHAVTEAQIHWLAVHRGVKVWRQAQPGWEVQLASGHTVLLRVPVADLNEQACRTWVARLPDPARVILVLSGGDTAALVCRALGARAIRLAAEVLPGVPYGTLLGGPAEGAVVVTKSGGFGEPEALARIHDAATGREGET